MKWEVAFSVAVAVCNIESPLYYIHMVASTCAKPIIIIEFKTVSHVFFFFSSLNIISDSYELR